jgi:hypothetical protein
MGAGSSVNSRANKEGGGSPKRRYASEMDVADEYGVLGDYYMADLKTSGLNHNEVSR